MTHNTGSTLRLSAIGLTVLLAAGPLMAQQPDTAPASAATQQSTQPAGELIQGVITAIKGDVRVRNSADEKWVPAKPGMVLTQGAEIQTGLRSAVQISMPPAQTLTLDRITTVKLVELVRDADKIKSNIGMQYGRTQLNIEKSGVSHDAKVQTPSTTLALRGTRVSVYDQAPFAPTAVSYTGKTSAQFRGRSFPINFGTNRYTVVDDENRNPAEQSQFGTGVNLRPDEGTTTTEQQMVSRYPMFNGTGGGIITGVTAVNKTTSSPYSRQINNDTVVTGGLAFPLPNPTIVNGQLQMGLLSPAGSNVKFTVVSPFNEFLNQQFGVGRLNATYAKTTTEAGTLQTVTWSTQYPEGGYIVRAQGIGLTAPTPVTFTVKQDTQTPVNFDRTLSSVRPTANIDLTVKQGATVKPN